MTENAGCYPSYIFGGHGFTYNLAYGVDPNGRIDIMAKGEVDVCPHANCYPSIVDNFFETAWPGTAYGRMFETHNVPTSSGDSVTEYGGYDLVIIKNPYRCWGSPNATGVGVMKQGYQDLFDLIAEPPEIHFGSAFGTPLRWGHDAYSQILWEDSTEAKLIYGLYRWWKDTLVAPANVFKFDTYGPLLQLGNVQDKYFMDIDYYDNTDGSHINSDAVTVLRPQFLADLETAVVAIMDERFANVTDTGGGEPTPTPPVANFSGTPLSGELPLEVTFTDLSTNTPTSWDWDWGDGTTHGTTQNPSHTYTEAGSYTVTLTATNADGSDDEVKVSYVTVTAPEPEPQAGKRYTIQPRDTGGGNSPSYLIEVKK